MSKLSVFVLLMAFLMPFMALGSEVCYTCQGVNDVNHTFELSENESCEQVTGGQSWYTDSPDCSISNPTSSGVTFSAFVFLGIFLLALLLVSVLWVRVPFFTIIVGMGFILFGGILCSVSALFGVIVIVFGCGCIMMSFND